jgi:DNA-binding MarR family transcriptional regulator
MSDPHDAVALVSPTEVARHLRPVLLKLNRELRRETATFGVTGSQAALLSMIRKSPGIGVRELAARERIAPASMSVSVARLEKAGFVRRTDDPLDRRRQALWVTEDGERILRTVRTRRTAWLAARLNRLPPEKLAAVYDAIEPLADLLEDDEAL